MRNISHPNQPKSDGIYTGRTHRGIPALLPPEGNRRTYIRGPKGHSVTTKHKRYERFF
jgi:hypothetical protein